MEPRLFAAALCMVACIAHAQSFKASVAAESPTIALEPLADETIAAELQGSSGGPERIGIGRNTAEAFKRAAASAVWAHVEGGQAAHLRLVSPGAAALRVGLSVDSIAPGMQLRFSGADGAVHGPYAAQDAGPMAITLWSPVLGGDAALVEVFVPQAQSGGRLPLVTHLSHLLTHPAQALPKASSTASCSRDPSCFTFGNPSDATQSGSDSVARMTFVDAAGASYRCDGTLLNSYAAPRRPYFFTSAGCIASQAIANTVTTHWFVESATCGGPLGGDYEQKGGGATIVYADPARDVLFMRLNAAPPQRAVFANWYTGQENNIFNSSVVGIQHPGGGHKKIALGDLDPAANGPTAPLWTVRWSVSFPNQGVANSDTRGGALFKQFLSSRGLEHVFAGALQSGEATCSSPREPPTYYSRMDTVYPALALYLDPGLNILVNPGFESGITGWSATNPTLAGFARSGNRNADIGGLLNRQNYISQKVMILQSARRATFQFWFQLRSGSPPAATPEPITLDVIDTVTGTRLETLMSLDSKTQSTAIWSRSPAFDLMAYRGRPITMRFTATIGADPVDLFIDDVALRVDLPNYTGLWWNPDESGWGVNFAHQGDTLFATLFTYDAKGAPMWLVMSAGTRATNTERFDGKLYRTTGPAFNAAYRPGEAALSTEVGTMSVAFEGDTATLAYNVDGVAVSKTIRQIAYGGRRPTCHSTDNPRAALRNYQDLWWNPAESGWGLNLAHQDDVLFGTLFTYDESRSGTWFVASSLALQSDGSYSGDLHRARGPAFNATPFTPLRPEDLTRVGTMRVRFTDGANGTLDYSVDGVVVGRPITRMSFGSVASGCAH